MFKTKQHSQQNGVFCLVLYNIELEKYAEKPLQYVRIINDGDHLIGICVRYLMMCLQ